jgi:DNA ligase-1
MAVSQNDLFADAIATPDASAFSVTLYINHSSGQTGSWAIEVVDLGDGTAEIVTTATKVLGGKSVVSREVVSEGKNIGRANETTPLEQAVSQARSKANKKRDKGYTETIPEAGTKATNSLGLVKPMLAKEFKAVEAFPVLAQPKLDGNRCLAARVDGEIKMWSRGGKPINLPHVAKALDAVLPEGLIVDGELYCHGETLQTITSWIKKLRPESDRVRYHIYDAVMDEACFSERIGRLEDLIEENESLCVVTTRSILDDGALQTQHREWLEEGFEGTMVRAHGIGYEVGKRAKQLQKLKDFQDAEFEIVDVEQGKPRITDEATYEVAVYRCVTADGKTFTVTAPGDMHAKHRAWEERDSAIGRQLTVKYFNYTPDGVPYLPVALRIRDDL